MTRPFSELEQNIGYVFKNKKLLEKAMTHTSYANEHKMKKEMSNERLEFVGDAIVDFVVGLELFRRCPGRPEGELSKMRASAVCEQGLKEAADKIKLGQYLMLGNGEEHMGGRERASIISDAFEALSAAIYLDSDFPTVQKWILKLLKCELDEAIVNKGKNDYKTVLQEFVQQRGKYVHYEVMAESGPEHSKQFTVCVFADDTPLRKGIGKSKKEAEQNAAKNALQTFKKI